MKSLLLDLKNHPNNSDLIKDLSNKIRSNWNYYSPERPYCYITFSEVFSSILMLIEKGSLKTQNDLLKTFQKLYYKEMISTDRSMNKSIDLEDEISLEDVVKVSRLKYDNLEPYEFLILYDALSRLSKGELIKDHTTLNVLRKIKMSRYYDIYDLPRVLNNINFGSLYLLNELGIQRFIEFKSYLDIIGIDYHPINETDLELSSKLKTETINRFSSILDQVDVKHLPLLEKFWSNS